MEYKLKITYKMNEKELYDYNMFRMTHKSGSVVARAVIVACIYEAMILLVAWFTKFELYMYFIFCPLGILIFAGTLLFTKFKMKQSVNQLLYRANKEALMPETTIEITEKKLRLESNLFICSLVNMVRLVFPLGYLKIWIKQRNLHWQSGMVLLRLFILEFNLKVV